MNDPYPKEIVHFIADHHPDCMSLWASLWDKANDDATILLSRRQVRDDMCSSYTITINRLRKMAKSGLVDFFELNESTVRIELVNSSLFGDVEDFFS